LPWEQVIEQVERLHPNIGPFLATGTLVSIEGNRVTIGYPKTASVASTRIQKEETRRLIAGICGELAGQSVRVHVIELQDGQLVGPSPAQVRADKERTHKHLLLEQARTHPLVRQAFEIFGAELVEVRHTIPQEEPR
jgi:DNA polymerase-3 subunit gamma/tau